MEYNLFKELSLNYSSNRLKRLYHNIQKAINRLQRKYEKDLRILSQQNAPDKIASYRNIVQGEEKRLRDFQNKLRDVELELKHRKIFKS